MYRTLFKFAVTTITILTVNLITSEISNYLVSYKNQYKPLTFTLISMGIITLIFYPLFMWMEDWLNTLSARVMKGGKSLLGLVFIYFICMSVLFYFYARMWYNIDIVKLLFRGRLGYYF